LKLSARIALVKVATKADSDGSARVGGEAVCCPGSGHPSSLVGAWRAGGDLSLAGGCLVQVLHSAGIFAREVLPLARERVAQAV
jgi:hypothetical protein